MTTQTETRKDPIIHCPEVDVLARTIYGEARGEYFRPDGGLASFIAVASVIRNRVKGSSKYGDTYEEVCRKPYQFSCWNQSDANFLVVTRIRKEDDRVFDICYDVARKMVAGTWPDITNGANHYHAGWMKTYPSWSEGRPSVFRCGQHIFYKL